MFRSVLIANRGEIAARIIRTLKRLGIEAIGIASDSDRFTLPMRMADRVMRLGPGGVAETYLNIDAIITACHESGAEAVHPGYGFLSENAAFAERLAAEGLHLEPFVSAARHIEVQIFGDGKGGVIALGERDCSLQRRNQKVVEETPAPNILQPLREKLRSAALALGKAVKYESVGTIEFVYDVEAGEAYFLEVNTRLQVEHPVTEEV